MTESSFLTDVTNVPLPQMLEQLGLAIANTQKAIDENAISIAQLMGDKDNHGVQFSGDDEKKSLLELGFTPTFYHLSEATVDLRVSLSMSTSRETSASASASVAVAAYFVVVAASVSASYTNKYSYEASSSSAITARFVSVPPPTTFNTFLNTIRDQDNSPAPDPDN